jgi:hypothetical protein
MVSGDPRERGTVVCSRLTITVLDDQEHREDPPQASQEGHRERNGSGDTPKQDEKHEPLDQADEIRLDIELLQLEMRAIRQRLEGEVVQGVNLDLTQDDEEAIRGRIDVLRTKYLTKSKEVRKKQRQLSGLQERLGESASPEKASPNADRNAKVVEQSRKELLKQLDDHKDP